MADFYVCNYCHGSGQVDAPGPDMDGSLETVPCSRCNRAKYIDKPANPGAALEAAIRAMQKAIKKDEERAAKKKLNEVNFPATGRGFRQD